MRGRAGTSGRHSGRSGRRSNRLAYAAVALFCVLWIAVIALAATLGGGDASGSRAAEQALRAAGCETVERIGGCTSCEADLYFSHRRDRGLTGRQGVVAAVA